MNKLRTAAICLLIAFFTFVVLNVVFVASLAFINLFHSVNPYVTDTVGEGIFLHTGYILVCGVLPTYVIGSALEEDLF